MYKSIKCITWCFPPSFSASVSGRAAWIFTWVMSLNRRQYYDTTCSCRQYNSFKQAHVPLPWHPPPPPPPRTTAGQPQRDTVNPLTLDYSRPPRPIEAAEVGLILALSICSPSGHKEQQSQGTLSLPACPPPSWEEPAGWCRNPISSPVLVTLSQQSVGGRDGPLLVGILLGPVANCSMSWPGGGVPSLELFGRNLSVSPPFPHTPAADVMEALYRRGRSFSGCDIHQRTAGRKLRVQCPAILGRSRCQ